MAKKWKAYPWPDRNETIEVEDEEEIDVVGDSPANKQATATCWGPSSPTAGATAPSPPPHSPKGSTILYNGESKIFKKPISPSPPSQMTLWNFLISVSTRRKTWKFSFWAKRKTNEK